jgi:hypothetical protein
MAARVLVEWDICARFLGIVKYILCVILCNGGDILVKSLTKTRKVGGSLVVTLPKKLVESQKIKEGEMVEITVKKLRKDGFGALKGIKPFTAEDELTAHE